MASTTDRQQLQGQVVAHALEHEQLGAGDQLGGALTAAEGVTSGSTSPWITTVGTSSAARPSARLPDARIERSWRATPEGWKHRS